MPVCTEEVRITFASLKWGSPPLPDYPATLGWIHCYSQCVLEKQVCSSSLLTKPSKNLKKKKQLVRYQWLCRPNSTPLHWKTSWRRMLAHLPMPRRHQRSPVDRGCSPGLKTTMTMGVQGSGREYQPTNEYLPAYASNCVAGALYHPLVFRMTCNGPERHKESLELWKCLTTRSLWLCGYYFNELTQILHYQQRQISALWPLDVIFVAFLSSLLLSIAATVVVYVCTRDPSYSIRHNPIK